MNQVILRVILRKLKHRKLKEAASEQWLEYKPRQCSGVSRLNNWLRVSH